MPASYAVSMLMPYYANDLDRFPLEEMPWGIDHTELWPYDTAYSFRSVSQASTRCWRLRSRPAPSPLASTLVSWWLD